MNQHIGAGAGIPACFAAQGAQKQASAVELTSTTLDGHAIVWISGVMDSRASGQVYDTLVQCIVEGRDSLIVELSGVPRISRAGARGLIVAARLIQPGRGCMRICGANASVESFLQQLGFGNLLKIDPTLEVSMAELAGDGQQNLPCPNSKRPEHDYSTFLEMVVRYQARPSGTQNAAVGRRRAR
jgi:anti-anti-sigma factor